jgi:hypothetical protein
MPDFASPALDICPQHGALQAFGKDLVEALEHLHLRGCDAVPRVDAGVFCFYRAMALRKEAANLMDC